MFSGVQLTAYKWQVYLKLHIVYFKHLLGLEIHYITMYYALTIIYFQRRYCSFSNPIVQQLKTCLRDKLQQHDRSLVSEIPMSIGI